MNPGIPTSDSTCWTLIRGAASGASDASEQFVRRYYPAVRAYLAARWRQSPLLSEMDDAVQEVFVECLRQGGALDHVGGLRQQNFRAFLYGVVRNVARMTERRVLKQRDGGATGFDFAVIEAQDESLSRQFDRAWARSVIREALALQASRAATAGPRAARWIELLRERFYENRPVREIARLWGEPAEQLHREVAKARDAFAEVLREVLSYHVAEPDARIEKQCEMLLKLLR